MQVNTDELMMFWLPFMEVSAFTHGLYKENRHLAFFLWYASDLDVYQNFE